MIRRVLLPLLVLAGCSASDDDSDAALPTEGTLSMLTYNVQGLPDALADSDRPTLERMQAIAPLLEPFDIVGLQEDFDPDFHAALTDTPHVETHWFDDPVDESRVYGAGLTFLTYPTTTAYDEAHYAECNGVLDGASDCLASKGWQRITLQLGAGQLSILNTHHEAGGGEADDAARRSQVLEVIEAIDALDGHAIVVLGDTNLRPSDPADVDELQLYADAGLRDACTEVSCDQPDEIDRFLVRDGDGLTLTVDSWADLSPTFRFPEGDDMADHPPLEMVLSWANAPE
jgi:endonuclease/exonuclease/phosphatase family metal-dependent hydrolase